MRTVNFLSDLRLSKGHLRILTLFGLTHGTVAPSFFYKTMFNMSGNLSMVVKILDNHVFCHASPKSAAREFWSITRCFQDELRIHRLIELNLVAGANFALGWIQKWHPRLNFVTMSLSLPSSRESVALRVRMDATLQPA
jgi:hypothetical protein